MTLISITSCKKDCRDEYVFLTFEKVSIDCIIWPDISYNINDDSTYQAQLSSCGYLPEINFAQYTLIGKLMSGQCNEDCYKIKDVCINVNEGVILIHIKRKTGNPFKCSCKKEFSTMNWLRIPKLVANYEVKVQIK